MGRAGDTHQEPRGKIRWLITTIAIALSAVVVAGAATPDRAHANSLVSAGSGGVIFAGDNNPHHLAVWISDVDVASRDWVLTGSVWATASIEAVRQWYAREWTRWQPIAEQAIASIEMIPPLNPDLPLEIRSARANYNLSIMRLRVEASLVTDAIDEHVAAITAGGIDRILSTSESVADAERSFADAADHFHRAYMEMYDLIDRSTTWGQQLFRSVGLTSERFAWLSGVLGKLGRIATWSSLGLTALSMLSHHQVVIRDTPGNELTAIPPCRDMVREARGDVVPHMVSCPAPAISFLGLVDFSWLTVDTGSGVDDIRLRLPEGDRNPFDEVTVNAGAGNDSIIGSDFGEDLRGGSGDDEIKGRGGDDRIYGQDGGFPSSSIALDNDTLFGGSGSDVVDGEWGHDKIFGGGGDDARLLGASLLGGEGNDVIEGGTGSDTMDGGDGRDTILARESDFSVDRTNPASPKRQDEVDPSIDCGPWTGATEQYVTFGTAEGGNVFGCIQPPVTQLTHATLLGEEPDALGQWPWFR